jgi:hypothetical protein
LNKDNQIKELAELICTGCAEYDECEWQHGRCECVLREAHMLHNAGYRKPPTGTWLRNLTIYGNSFWRCSLCGHTEELPEGIDPTIQLPFCTCGAKMVNTTFSRGTWRIETDEEEPNFMFKLVVCSECGKTANSTYDFCPNCGTEMFTGEKDDD